MTGTSYPKEVEKMSSDDEKYHLVLLFDKHKSWKTMAESKLRPFCQENDTLFLEKADKIVFEYQRNHVFKAYKKAQLIIEQQAKEKQDKKKNFFKSLFNLDKI